MIIKIYWTCWTVNVELDVGYKKNLIVVLLEIFSLSFVLLVCECLNSDCMACFSFLFCLPFHDFYLSRCAQVWLKPRPLLSLVHSMCGTDNTIHSGVHRQTHDVVTAVKCSLSAWDGRYWIDSYVYGYSTRWGVLSTLNGCGQNSRWLINSGCKMFFAKFCILEIIW